ncbi:MAG TPA: zf-HC2 domain-containing protein, partial [Bacteroidota bacterium]|nr:zf-HC2 domain-containing protein [Bacteroidota bacterium]
MNCKKLRYSIPDFVRDKISAEEKLLVDNHLVICSSCREEVEAFRALFAEMGHDVAWKPSENYLATILPRVHDRLDKKHAASLPVWITRLAVPLASAAVIVVFLTTILPLTITDSSSNYVLSLSSVSTDDLNQYVEQQTVVGVSEFSFADNKMKESNEDKIILKNILGEEHTGYRYLTSNQESIDDVVSDRDA